MILFQAKNLRELQAIANPSNDVARTLLSERYGVALPNLQSKRDQPKEVRIVVFFVR